MRYLMPNIFQNTFRNIIQNFSSYRTTRLLSSANHPDKKGLILGVYDGDDVEPHFTPAAQKFNEHSCGKLAELVKACRSELGKGRAKIFNNIDKEFWAVAVVGLGSENQGYNEVEAIDTKLEGIRCAAAIGARMLQKEGTTTILVDGLSSPEQAAEGASLALWKYQEYKNADDWAVIPTIELFDDPDTQAWRRGLLKAESQNFARRLTDTPANIMTPLHFAQETVNELCPGGLRVHVHNKEWIESKKLNAFLAVARGSCEPPVCIDISYCAGPTDLKPILFVGKGITFDSGGLCTKKCSSMSDHRADMCGAASVVAAISAANALCLPLNLHAFILLCENMPSGMAMKCGDILKGINGKSIQILDTTNEGRLVMADGLAYGQKEYDPKLIIDVATMTQGIRQALGSSASGIFCNSQTMWEQVKKAGMISGDRVWRMPLWKYYKRQVTNFTSHDVNNTGKGSGDSCLAAAFLNEFISCVDWIHFDITGVGMKCDDKLTPYLTKGRMTGRPTRTLIQLLQQLSECQNK